MDHRSSGAASRSKSERTNFPVVSASIIRCVIRQIPFSVRRKRHTSNPAVLADDELFQNPHATIVRPYDLA
jgi:hypothetical protein